MVEFNAGHAILGAALAWGVTRKLDEQAAKADAQEQPSMPREVRNEPVEEQLSDLHALERRNRPDTDAIDGYVGTTIEDLSPGGTATVRITPTRGNELMVKKLKFDRRSDHEYEFLIGGVPLTSNHQLPLQAPRKVMRGKPIVATVTNNSSSDSTFDFEGDMWGIPTANGLGRR